MKMNSRILAIGFILLLFGIPGLGNAYNKSWDQGHEVCVNEPGTSNWGKFDKGGVFHGGYTSKECFSSFPRFLVPTAPAWECIPRRSSVE
jgi:hypothetical protein